jgi:hypothetical protein
MVYFVYVVGIAIHVVYHVYGVGRILSERRLGQQQHIVHIRSLRLKLLSTALVEMGAAEVGKE